MTILYLVVDGMINTVICISQATAEKFSKEDCSKVYIIVNVTL